MDRLFFFLSCQPIPPIGIMAAYLVRYRKAVTYVAVDGSFAGFLALSDTLRQESAETIAALSNLGVQPSC